MAEDVRTGNESGIEPSFRLAAIIPVLAIAAVILFIPVRIGTLGHIPCDDALRHAAKAISGKPWGDILVLRNDFKTDTHPGWHAILSFLHRRAGLDTYGLMVFSVSICFIIFASVPAFLLKRPETWLMTILGAIVFDPYFAGRLLIGRPFVLVAAAFAAICLTWKNLRGRQPPWQYMIILYAVMSVTAWIYPTTYLFAFPVLCFVLAREFRAALRFFLCIAAGTVTGYLMTGHPVDLALDTLTVLFNSPDMNILSRMLVTELQPRNGSFPVFIFMAVVMFFKWTGEKLSRDTIDNPVFITAIAGFVLGHVVGRFWLDWGMIAAMAWIARELDTMLEEKLEFGTWKRAWVCIVTTVVFFIIMTSDMFGRWSWRVPRYPLKYSECAEENRPWFPDSGGIIYSDHMGIFYDMFFDNPDAPWRYVLGFEPALMTPRDRMIYRAIQRSGRAWDSFGPWVDSMNPSDRMIIFTDSDPQPFLNRLEWKYLTRSTWVGRLPREKKEAGEE